MCFVEGLIVCKDALREVLCVEMAWMLIDCKLAFVTLVVIGTGVLLVEWIVGWPVRPSVRPFVDELVVC